MDHFSLRAKEGDGTAVTHEETRFFFQLQGIVGLCLFSFPERDSEGEDSDGGR